MSARAFALPVDVFNRQVEGFAVSVASCVVSAEG